MVLVADTLALRVQHLRSADLVNAHLFRCLLLPCDITNGSIPEGLIMQSPSHIPVRTGR